MENDQKPRCSSCMVIETLHFRILPFLLRGYHTPKLKNIAILAIAFSPHNFKILPTCHMESFWVSNPTYIFLEIGRSYVSIIITIMSNTTVLLSHDVICFRHFMPMSYGDNKQAFTIVSPPPHPLNRFSPGLFVVLQEILYLLFFAVI